MDRLVVVVFAMLLLPFGAVGVVAAVRAITGNLDLTLLAVVLSSVGAGYALGKIIDWAFEEGDDD